MDHLTITVQQARVVSFIAQSLQAISQFSIVVDDKNNKQKRAKAVLQQRCQWNRFVMINQDLPLFCRHLRMSYDSFLKLLHQIRTHLPEPDQKMAGLRGGVIIPELQLYATLQYLAGGSYSDICFFCGISRSSFYKVMWDTIPALNKVITVTFPASAEECAIITTSFEKVNYSSVISNCVGVLDGYLLPIVTPCKKHAKNVRSYFSGHYQKYGINIQACCDAQCQFTFLGIGGPGVTKDRTAIKDSELADSIEQLPLAYICIADCAYQPTEKVIPIFGGDLALNKDNDNFNSFALQLHIRIEMAFGLMTRKWGILQRPLSNSLLSIKHLICAISRLHNYCINER